MSTLNIPIKNASNFFVVLKIEYKHTFSISRILCQTFLQKYDTNLTNGKTNPKLCPQKFLQGWKTVILIHKTTSTTNPRLQKSPN